MRKEVEEFLKARESEKETAQSARRRAHLLELGLYRVELLADALKERGGEETAELDQEFQDFEGGERCRKIPLDVTEEEYAAICEKAPEEPQKAGWPVLPVYQILFVLAMLVYAGGFILGISTGYSADYYYGGFYWLAAVSAWGSAAISGSLLLALSEHVRLMKKLNGET